MSFSYVLNWLVDEHVVLITMTDKIDVQTVNKLSEDLHALLDTSTKDQIYMIIDDRQTIELPSLAQVNRLQSSLKHPKISWIISIGKNINPIVKFVSAVAVRIAHLKFKRVENLEEAIDTLKEIDTTINWQSAKSENA